MCEMYWLAAHLLYKRKMWHELNQWKIFSVVETFKKIQADLQNFSGCNVVPVGHGGREGRETGLVADGEVEARLLEQKVDDGLVAVLYSVVQRRLALDVLI